MATKLVLRDTTANAIGSFKDMLTTFGAASATGVVNTAASGTEIQWTQTAGGTVLEFISGRSPAGGWTLAGTMTFSIWAHQSHMNANCGGRARVFIRTAAGVETEIGGGPWDDGVEFGTAAAEMTWTGTPTSTAFAEDDRLIVRYYITNVGTMGGPYTCTLTYNDPDATTGDSFFQINETVAFKAESTPTTVTVTTATIDHAEQAIAVNAQTAKAVTAQTLAYTAQPITVSNSTATTVTVVAAAIANTAQAIVVNAKTAIAVTAASLAYAGQALIVNAKTLKAVAAATMAYAGQFIALATTTAAEIHSMVNQAMMLFAAFYRRKSTNRKTR